MRNSVVAVAVLCAGCASYATPGGPVRLDQIGGGDNGEVVTRLPAPHFPASIAVVRVQAPEYKSYTADSYGKGRFSLVTAQELLNEEQVKSLTTWPAVDSATTLNPALLPIKLESLGDLRLAAAKLQADILLVFTVETAFQVKGQAYAPLSSIKLGGAPDADASVSSTASAVFTDVRTGYTYGSAQATAKLGDLASSWGSAAVVDKRRLEAEHLAFTQLLAEVEKTWAGIATQYQ
ncbi:hypothetical protein [Hydrocarboniphaga sp.]|uniref:hypothetical protein n=1 Tax=Hydrocarboniphaga sp. TaxID=2033016 RepID=UPI0026316F3B|nr:hypothetical protein [Hydrocarboniphaga sp.]